MEIHLQPEVEAMIEDYVKSGRYRSTEAVVSAAVTAMRESEASDGFQPGEWNALLKEAEESGEPLDGPAVFAEIRARHLPDGHR